MDGFTVFALICGLVLGAVVGALAGAQVARARRETTDAQADAELARLRGTASDARAESAEARRISTEELAEARRDAAGELAEVRRHAAEELAGLRERSAQEINEIRVQLADTQQQLTRTHAAEATAISQRDHALARLTEVATDRESMLDQFKLLSTEALERQAKATDATADRRAKETEKIMVPVQQSLQLFSSRLTEVEKERAAISAELRTQVTHVQRTGEELRRETAALVTALRKPQVRGSWGETQLKRVAELSGMLERCDFDLQHTTKADDRVMRPDMRVHLAEGKHVFVDSKVPLTGFLDAAETEDETRRAEALGRYAKNVKTHIDQLSNKQYWKAADSPEFVVLFLPSESFFATALDQIPDLYEYAAARDVVLATPTTLIGLLRAVAYGWKQAALAESAGEVFRLGRDLYERLGLMGGRLDKLGRALRSSVNAYNETIGTVERTVLVPARRFRDLKVSDAELAAIESVDEPVRQIAAPELVDDAVKVKPMIGRTSRRRCAVTPCPRPPS